MTEIETDMLCVMELREKVAKAIHESNRIVPWEQTCQQDIAFERADAAIAVVLEEAAKAMKDLAENARYREQIGDDDMQVEHGAAADAFCEAYSTIRALSRNGGE